MGICRNGLMRWRERAGRRVKPPKSSCILIAGADCVLILNNSVRTRSTPIDAWISVKRRNPRGHCRSGNGACAARPSSSVISPSRFRDSTARLRAIVSSGVQRETARGGKMWHDGFLICSSSIVGSLGARGKTIGRDSTTCFVAARHWRASSHGVRARDRDLGARAKRRR